VHRCFPDSGHSPIWPCPPWRCKCKVMAGVEYPRLPG
jgi:hypothetical protein